MADQRTTDLGPIASITGDGMIDVVDVNDTTQDPAGSSFKISKADFLKEATAAILLNTAKVGITTGQAAAILLNTAKVGITTDQAAAILLNTAKVGITTTQAAAILLNTAKVGITSDQAAAILLNTAKVGITTGQAAAILLNTAKVGITTDQAASILLNTAKVGITTSQAAAILLNTAKVGITPAQANAITDNTANTSKVSINNDAASIANVRSLRYREETYSSNLDMVMQTEVGVYNWVNIKTNAFNVVTSLVTRFKNRVATDGGVFSNQTALETFLGTIIGSLNTVLAAITPNGVKTGKLFSVIPNTAELDATVVRNTTSTTINSLGLIVDVAANVPRINFTLNTGGEGFILDEPQRTNVIIQSNGFQTSSWAKSGSTAVIPIVTANSFASPDGTINSALVEITSVADGEFSTLIQAITSITDNTTLSVFLRAFDASQVGKKVSVLGNGTAGVAGIVATLSLSWQRFTFNRTSQINQLLIGKGRSSFASGGVSQAEMATKFYIYESQLEVGNTASSTIKTTTTAITRNADVITLAPPTGTVKITTTFSDNTTQVLTTIPGVYTIPEGLIKSVNFNNTL